MVRRVPIQSSERSDAGTIQGSDIIPVYRGSNEEAMRGTAATVADYVIGALSDDIGPGRITPWVFGVTKTGEASAANDTCLVTAINYARDNGLILDFQNIPVFISAVKTFTAPGTYSWRNYSLTKRNPSGITEVLFTFTGPSYDTAIELASDAAARSTTVAVTAGQGSTIVAGARYLLVSTAIYTTTGSSTINVSEYITARSVAVDTVTLAEPLKSSYATASYASLLRCDQSMVIDFAGGIVSGSGAEHKQTGFQFNRCLIMDGDVAALDVEDRAYAYVACWFSGEVSARGENIDRAGLGYLIAAAGCDEPKFGTLIGRRVRHTDTVGGTGASVTWTAQSASRTAAIMGRGGYCKKTHCDEAIGSIHDQHPGHAGFEGPDVSGNFDATATDAAVTIQSSDVSVGRISTSGSSGASLLVQLFGKPSDEGPMRVTHGAIDNLGNGPADQYALIIQNKDATNRAAVIVSGPSVDLDGGGGIDMAADEGDIYYSLQRANITSHASALRTVYLLASANGRAILDICMAHLHDASASSSRYCVQAEGALYTAAHATVPGARVRIASGLLTKDTSSGTPTALRAIDSLVELGADVEVVFPGGGAFKSISGVGQVYRTSRAIATS